MSDVINVLLAQNKELHALLRMQVETLVAALQQRATEESGIVWQGGEIITRLEKRVAALEAALKPFADTGKNIPLIVRNNHIYRHDHRAEHYRAAAAVLFSTPDDSERTQVGKQL